MKINFKILFLILFFVFLTAGLITYLGLKKPVQPEEEVKGLMVLIEYKDTVGLSNFVNEMNKRNIKGLLLAGPEFVEDNCSDIKKIISHNVEIMASISGDPLWGMSLEEQKSRIAEAKNIIEACTGVPIRIITSTYMASDINTLKAAEDLGIPYVAARGTTGTKATVYEIEGYNTKILSISNIPKVQFEYGSLCDYSYFERGGSPEDMKEELMRAIEPLSEKDQARYGSIQRVTPVSHTNIGGYLEPWMNMWLSFWDETKNKIKWVGLDEFMVESDWVLPEWQIPLNKNAPYTPEKIRPLILYEDVEKVQNPCAVENIGQTVDKIIMFHNGKGPMCLEASEFLKTIDYPTEQVLDSEQDFGEKLNEAKANFSQSEGVSSSFGYYPIIFVGNRAFSGFNQDIKNEILKEIGK
jgi:hypothetical protein